MYERMLNKKEVPAIADMEAYCGENAGRFTLFNNWLSETYGTSRQIAFPYGNYYGWGIAHRIKQKLICNVFAEAGAFTVMIRLSNQQYESVYDCLQKHTQSQIDNKYSCGDGGWIQYRVLEEGDLEEIKKIASAKCLR